ncbi:MAG: SMP-30/gluconolactonase/LRE family protein [Bryobacteraceae bacterium]|nr:SMP-30/gluconolactonase/LRE family protein [Bryobacteraceae bacterium]
MVIPIIALALLAQDEAPKSLADFETRIDRVSARHLFTEGPVWVPEGYLLFSDVPSNLIQKFVPGKGSTAWREKSNGTNGNAVDADGHLYSCETRTRRVVRTNLKTGAQEVLAERYEGKRFNAPNDICVRKDRNVYFTDPAFGQQSDTRELDFYGIYRLSPKNELSLVAKTAGRPNGVTLAPNGRLLYVANSDERSVLVFDVDRAGAVSNQRVFVSGITGPPDGLRTDEKGNVYVACDDIAIYSSQGKLVKSIKTPEPPRNLAFGDADLMTLYITAYTSVYRVRLPIKGATY